jgi:hypothetical protein
MAQSQSNDPTDNNQNGKASPAQKAGESNNDPIAMLSADHRHVEQLFSAFEKAKDSDQKRQLADQICTEFKVHTLLEEEIFYRACKGKMEDRQLEEAQVEHDGAKALIIEVENGSPEDEYFNAKVKVLSENIKHHVQEEEKPNEGIFAQAKKKGINTAELAQQLAERKQKLMEQAEAGGLGPPEMRSFHSPAFAQRHSQMMRRDERRFMEYDDRDTQGARRRGRHEDWQVTRPREEDERRYARSHRDEDEDRRGGRGHGGWYGDPEGHSEASRHAWEERGGSRYDDDERYYSRSRYENDERRGGRGPGGWYGDPEGHSEAARRGWEERSGPRLRYDDERHYGRSRYEVDERRGGRGHGGWYGDPEGHSEASHRGWEERGGSRSRYDDDDRRGRDHGGWYGDPEGHAEAARHRRR